MVNKNICLYARKGWNLKRNSQEMMRMREEAGEPQVQRDLRDEHVVILFLAHAGITQAGFWELLWGQRPGQIHFMVWSELVRDSSLPACFPVNLWYPSRPTYWGSMAVVLLEIEMLQEAKRLFPQASWFYIVSGDSVPCKPPSLFVSPPFDHSIVGADGIPFASKRAKRKRKSGSGGGSVSVSGGNNAISDSNPADDPLPDNNNNIDDADDDIDAALYTGSPFMAIKACDVDPLLAALEKDLERIKVRQREEESGAEFVALACERFTMQSKVVDPDTDNNDSASGNNSNPPTEIVASTSKRRHKHPIHYKNQDQDDDDADAGKGMKKSPGAAKIFRRHVLLSMDFQADETWIATTMYRSGILARKRSRKLESIVGEIPEKDNLNCHYGHYSVHSSKLTGPDLAMVMKQSHSHPFHMIVRKVGKEEEMMMMMTSEEESNVNLSQFITDFVIQ